MAAGQHATHTCCWWGRIRSTAGPAYHRRSACGRLSPAEATPDVTIRRVSTGALSRRGPLTAGLGGATEEGEQEEEDVEVDAQVGVHAAAAAFHGVEGGVVLEGGRGARRRLRLPVAEVQQGAHAAQNEHGAELVETHKRAPQPTFVPPIKAARQPQFRCTNHHTQTYD